MDKVASSSLVPNQWTTGDTSDDGPIGAILGKPLWMALAVAAQIETIGIDGRPGKENKLDIMQSNTPKDAIHLLGKYHYYTLILIGCLS